MKVWGQEILEHVVCKHGHRMHKLDEKKVRYIIREKRKGTKATISKIFYNQYVKNLNYKNTCAIFIR